MHRHQRLGDRRSVRTSAEQTAPLRDRAGGDLRRRCHRVRSSGRSVSCTATTAPSRVPVCGRRGSRCRRDQSDRAHRLLPGRRSCPSLEELEGFCSASLLVNRPDRAGGVVGDVRQPRRHGAKPRARTGAPTTRGLANLAPTSSTSASSSSRSPTCGCPRWRDMTVAASRLTLAFIRRLPRVFLLQPYTLGGRNDHHRRDHRDPHRHCCRRARPASRTRQAADRHAADHPGRHLSARSSARRLPARSESPPRPTASTGSSCWFRSLSPRSASPWFRH